MLVTPDVDYSASHLVYSQNLANIFRFATIPFTSMNNDILLKIVIYIKIWREVSINLIEFGNKIILALLKIDKFGISLIVVLCQNFKFLLFFSSF